jgi:acyl carrier protein
MSVEGELIRNIAKVARCREQDLKPETQLKNIKADSLHWVQIIVGVENALNIEIDIDKERMSKLATINDFVKYIEQFVQ